MRCPSAIPAAALCAGIVAGIFVCPDSAHRFAPLISAVFLIAAGAAFAFRRAPETLAFITCGFVTVGVALGGAADSEARRTPLLEIFDNVAGNELQVFAHIEGRLRSDATPGPSGITLDLHVERLTVGGLTYAASGGVLVGVGGVPGTDRILQWRAGRRVALPATLRRPTRYFNPGVPDSGRSLAWRRTSLVGSVKSDRLVDVAAAGNALSEMSASVRSRVRDAIGHSIAPWSPRSAAVVTAILIGDRAGLDDEVERRLQDAGTYHVIAISGGNIAIFAGLCLAVLRVLNAGVRLSALLVIALLACYAAIVEGGSSVGRATLMASVYFAARVFDQRTLPTNAACLTAAILISLDPLRVVDPGLALTFGATLGIVIGMSMLGDMLPTRKWARSLAVLFAASLCAEIALLPIGAFVFSRISFAGLVVNFAAIPLMTIAQLAGMCAVALTWLSCDAATPAAGWIAHMAVEGLVRSSSIVDAMPWLALRVAPPPLLIVGLYYVAIAIIVMQPAVESRLAKRAAIVIVICCAGWIVAAPSLDLSRLGVTAPLRVTFLDVGQGDAAIVQFPDGNTLSVDAGGLASGTFDIATRVVSPALWAIGVRRLDYLTITHGDVDHIGGAAGLFRDFRPPEVWEGVPVPPHAPTRELRALADAAATPWRTVHRFDRLAFGAVDLIVHHPSRPDWERQRIRNDDSEVIELRYGRVSFVFTGDIGRETERAIGSGFDAAAIRVLKVPHHGSATSSSDEFLNALRPDIAVISAGRGNPFGHPVRSVLERYRHIGAAIYRTDQDGAVTVETDGTTVRVRTFNGRQLTVTTNGR